MPVSQLQSLASSAIPTVRASRLRNLLLGAFIATAILLGSLGIFYYQAERQITYHAPHQHAILDIVQYTTLANLWLEGVVHGDQRADINTIRELFDEAEEYATALLKGGHKSDEGDKILALEPASPLRQQATELLKLLYSLRHQSEQRFAAYTLPGSLRVDQGADILFSHFIASAEKLKNAIEAKALLAHLHFKHIAWLIMGGLFICALLVSFLIVRFERQRSQDLSALQRAARESEAQRDALHNRSQRLNLAIEAAEGGIYEYKVATGELEYAGEGFAKHLDLDDTQLAGIQHFTRWLKERAHPDDKANLQQALEQFHQGIEEKFNYLCRVYRQGEWAYLQFRAHALERNTQGQVLQANGVVTDRTERKQFEVALFEEKERLQVTLHSIGDGVISTDPEGHIEYLNPAAERLTGWDAGKAVGEKLSTVFNIVDESSGKPVADPVKHCLEQENVVQLPAPSLLLNSNDDDYAIQYTAAPIHAPTGEIHGVVLVFKDVTEARRMEQELSYQATHDPLTGLVNRKEFGHRLHTALTITRENGAAHTLLFLDLDQFKLVNDTAGHLAGDALLQEIAQLLQSKIRTHDTLARLGGDEFAVLLEGCPKEKGLGIAQSMVTALRNHRFKWEGKTFGIGVSIGLVAINGDILDAVELMSQADVACYAAKDAGRNRVQVYEAEGADLSPRHNEILRATELTEHLENERFCLYAQAIMPLNDSHATLHLEILVRMLGNEGEILPPSSFIPAAERFGIMAAIDRWVIKTTLAQYHAVTASAGEVVLAINLSGNSLTDDDLLDFVLEQLELNKVPAESICFEITETAAIANLNQASHFIRHLRRHGCRFALDDFGSGLSSFSYLKKLPIDYLKIDGSFVRDLVDDPIDHAMVAAINQVGKIMGIQTIAEWVENTETMHALQKLGVDYAQGYGIDKPLPLDEIRRPTIRLAG